MYLEQYPIIIGIFTCMLVCTLMMVLIQMVESNSLSASFERSQRSAGARLR